MSNFKTEQESFWAGDFGDDYISRNEDSRWLAGKTQYFSKIFSSIPAPSSVIEFGPNIGVNLKAIKRIFPSIQLAGVEINDKAADILQEEIPQAKVYRSSILEHDTSEKFDVSLINGVLIHINPDELDSVYTKLYEASKRFIVIGEYYNPSPVAIPYRGHQDRLFKRDFAGEMMDKFSDLELRDYGFAYHRDPNFPQDDLTWFVLEKK